MVRPPRRRGGAVLVVALALATGPPAHAAPALAIYLPEGVPEAREAEGWERIEGEVASDSQRIDYALYVDPRYGALYVVTRYRITVISRMADGREERRPERETLIWNSRPGSREPLRCYDLQAPPAGEGRSPGEWRRVPAGTDEYRAAMATAVRLYGHHAEQLHAAAEP